MSSSNRRQGKSTRSTHLREAPAPVENGPTLTLAPEDTQVTCAQHVTVELTPEEYMELAGAREATSTDAPTALLAPHRANDDTDQHDEQSDQAHDDPADKSADETTPHDPPTPAAHGQERRVESDHDSDPHFETLATAPAAPTRSSGPPGSAALDTAPVRSPRQRASRLPARAQDHTAGRRRRGGWLILAAPVVAVVVLAIILEGTSRTPPAGRPAQASAPAHHMGAPTTVHQLTATINEKIAKSAKSAAPHAARRSARRSSAPHVKHRPSRRRHLSTPVQRAARPASQTSQHVQSAPAQGGAAGSTSTNGPVSAPPPTTTSNSSPPASTGGGSPKPPLYGQGGLLGAGHAG